MKKIIVLLVLAMTSKSMQAQGITDALRYAQTNLNGTARFNAMGGAFGALGGDLSSINVNPAGSVIFANNQVGGTLNVSNTKNTSTYFGNKTDDNKASFDLNQAGAVFVFDNDDQRSGWNKFALALNYENANNLDNSVLSSGTNKFNSIDKYFLSYANGIQKNILDNRDFSELTYRQQQAHLGYYSYIIDPSSQNVNNTAYITNVQGLGNYNQINSIESRGNNGKVSFNIGAQYNKKWSFGMNLNSHFSDYRRVNQFIEKNNGPIYATGSTVNSITFNNDLQVRVSGFSMQFGVIFKPVNEVRLGLAYESPTWSRVEEKILQNISTSGFGLDNPAVPTLAGSLVVNPKYETVFEPYTLQTPSKTTGSFAYIFGKRGLISADVAMKNYTGTVYTPRSQFLDVNNAIENNLNWAKEVRVGGEFKIEKVSIRGGYRWEESPYKFNKTYGDLTAFSGGLGFNFGYTKLDVSYAHSKRFYNESFFSQGLVDKANISEIRNNVTVSLLFEL